MASREKRRHKFEDADKATTEAAEKFVADSVKLNGPTPHLSLEATSCSVRFPAEHVSGQPSEIVDFVGRTLLDRHALQGLEKRKAINWAPKDVSGCIIPLRTDGDGNCLLHAAALSMWGIQDKAMMLRNLLHRTLREPTPAAEDLRSRWRAAREKQDAATKLEVELEDSQWEDEWKRQVVDLASSHRRTESAVLPYASLEQIHIFVLAQILRRPIVVLADDVVEGFQGDHLQELDMAGIYLPLMHSADDCVCTPLVLAYFESHFLGMVWVSGVNTIPICRRDGQRLPVPFLTPGEEARMELILDTYLNRMTVSSEEDTNRDVELVLAAQPTRLPTPVAALPAAYGASLRQLYREDCQAQCVTAGCKSYKRPGQDLCCSCSLRKPRSPPPVSTRRACKNVECDFFGDPKNDGFCSVCYRKQKGESPPSRRVTPSPVQDDITRSPRAHSPPASSPPQSPIRSQSPKADEPAPSLRTLAVNCATPGCESTEIEWRGFCPACLENMTSLWMMTNSPAQKISSNARATMEPPKTSRTASTGTQTTPFRTPQPLCRNCDRSYPEHDGYCSSCYRQQQAALCERDFFRGGPACRNSVPLHPLFSPSWPFLRGQV